MATKATAVAAWEALFRAQVTVMRRLSAEFPTDEISLVEYDVLFNLARHPDRAMRIRDLVEDLLITQPSVSRLVDRLAARGLITKASDPHDARGVVVALTEDGYNLFRRVAVEHSESISSEVGSALTGAELAQLTALCEKLRAGIRNSDAAKRRGRAPEHSA